MSVDGFTEGFEADQEAFYGSVTESREEVTLSGSNTVFAVGGEENPDEPWRGSSMGDSPIHAVIDSRGGVRTWDWLRARPHWRETVVIGSEATPADTRERWERRGLRVFIAGKARVDLRRVIEQLSEAFGARTIRLESGGTLNGLFLDQGLIDEAAMLVHPVVVGGRGRRTMLAGPDGMQRETAETMQVISCEVLPQGLMRLRFAAARTRPEAR